MTPRPRLSRLVQIRLFGTPDGTIEVLPAVRCEHCREWFAVRDMGRRRYCSRPHAAEGRRRTRLGLAPHIMPGATSHDLQVLAEIVRRVKAGELDWADVSAYADRRILPGEASMIRSRLGALPQDADRRRGPRRGRRSGGGFTS